MRHKEDNMEKILHEISSMSEDSQLTMLVLFGISCWAMVSIVGIVCSTLKKR